jgi:hypothetical protein
MSSTARELSLSSKGLQRFQQAPYEKDFRFIVGEVDYLCPLFIAEFLSPRVSFLRFSDGSIDKLEIELEDPNGYFGEFLRLGFGFSVEVSPGQDSVFRRICELLWNMEALDFLVGPSGPDFNREISVSRLNVLSRHDPGMPELTIDFSTIASHFYEFSVSDCEHFSFCILERILSDSELVIKSEDSLLEIVSAHVSRDSSSFSLLEKIRFEYLSETAMESAISLICDSFDQLNISLFTRLGSRLVLPVTPRPLNSRFSRSVVDPTVSKCVVDSKLDSKIISGFPAEFGSLHGKEFKLLYRGSRDGFRSSDFHRFCDNHAGTVTVIQSQDGYIFGGYTPLAWRSDGRGIRDNSLEGFIFTIKNPHGLSARVFGLRQGHAAWSIYCGADYGPTFGGGHDIHVCDQCNSSRNSYTNFDNNTYNNDTGLNRTTVFTGAYHFTVGEIEVFELTVSTPQTAN